MRGLLNLFGRLDSPTDRFHAARNLLDGAHVMLEANRGIVLQWLVVHRELYEASRHLRQCADVTSGC